MPTFPPRLAEGHDGATTAELAVIETSPTGLGLLWPTVDADLYVPALLGGVLGSPRWVAGPMGCKGGPPRKAARSWAVARSAPGSLVPRSTVRLAAAPHAAVLRQRVALQRVVGLVGESPRPAVATLLHMMRQ